MAGTSAEKQIISRKRVVDHGEVMTAKREVNAMLDLVKNETKRIESRFLEPACGTGNFLVEILQRKLDVVAKKYRRSQLEYEKYAVLAISSIYGIDIIPENVTAARGRLLGIFETKYRSRYKRRCKEQCLKVVRFILEKNIVLGDALKLKTTGDNPKPIIFSEWSPAVGNKIKRRDFYYDELIPQDNKEADLFSKTPKGAFIPQPVKQYPMTHFLKIADND